MRMKQILRLSGVLIFAACLDRTESPLAPVTAPTGEPQLTFGTPQYDGANAATVDPFGYIYVVGRTDGSLDGSNQGNSDFFIRKYHPEGEVLWADQYGTHLHDEATGVGVDNGGNVYVVGRTEGSLAGSRGGTDAFIRKYDTNGVLKWTRQFGSEFTDYATAVAVDRSSGNVYVVGTTNGHAWPHPGSDVAAPGKNRAFLLKYDANGVVIWARQFGTADHDYGKGVAIGATGAVYVVGHTAGQFAGGVCCASAGEDAFIRSFSPDGDVVWTRQFGTDGDDHANAVTVDPSGHLIIAGAALAGERWPSGWDAFVRKYDSAGSLITHLQFGTPGHDHAYAISANANGEFYVAGTTTGAFTGNSAGSADVFVRKYDSSNQMVWLSQFGTSADDRGFAVAARPGLGVNPPPVYVAGATAGTLVGANRGKYDAYLRSLSPDYGHALWTDQ